MRRVVVGLAALIVVFSTASASGILITIDFEEGNGQHDTPIPSSFYAAQGATFNNAVWIDLEWSDFHEGEAGLGVDNGWCPSNNWAFPGPSDPIEVLFAQDVSSVSILAKEVTMSGARLRAFDIGGTEIGSDQCWATHPHFIEETLTVNGVGIRRILLDQLWLYSGDGLGWDNLKFDMEPIPEPSSVVVWSLLAALGVTLRWRLTRKR